MINLLNVQTDIYNFIKGLGYKVVDEVTPETKCPYVRLGNTSISTINIKTNDSYSMLLYIDVFSDYKGSKEVKEIAYTIHDSMMKHSFSTENYSVNHSLYLMDFITEDNKQKETDKDKKYRHGVLIYKFNIYE